MGYTRQMEGEPTNRWHDEIQRSLGPRLNATCSYENTHTSKNDTAYNDAQIIQD